MKVQVLTFDGCPHRERTIDAVQAAAYAVGAAIDLERVRVQPGSDLVGLRFLGSPTVLVDGVDVEPSARSRTDFAFGCRVYGPSGGVPPLDLLRAALAAKAP